MKRCVLKKRHARILRFVRKMVKAAKGHHWCHDPIHRWPTENPAHIMRSILSLSAAAERLPIPPTLLQFWPRGLDDHERRALWGMGTIRLRGSNP